jgi:hypothetical protein
MLKLEANLCDQQTPITFAKKTYRLSCAGTFKAGTETCPGEVRPSDNVVIVCVCTCHS